MTDKHNNAHRANKKSFQVMLTAEEQKLLDDVKELRGIDTNKELFIKLLQDELKRSGGA